MLFVQEDCRGTSLVWAAFRDAVLVVVDLVFGVPGVFLA